MASFPVLLAKQEVPAFSYLWLFDSRRFLKEGVSRGAEHYGELKMSSLTVLLGKQEVPKFSCPKLIDLCCLDR